MQLPQPKVPKPKAAVPLPTPRLPGGAKAAAVQPPKAPSRTQDLRAASLASLTITGPTRAPRVGGGQARPRRDRSPSTPVGTNANRWSTCFYTIFNKLRYIIANIYFKRLKIFLRLSPIIFNF